jgi:hypothetical protein
MADLSDAIPMDAALTALLDVEQERQSAVAENRRRLLLMLYFGWTEADLDSLPTGVLALLTREA